MPEFIVPTVDITPYVDHGSSAERERVAAQIDGACRDVGFIQIVGHGIAQQTIDAFAAAMDTFFDQPLDAKCALIRPASENRGYTAPKSESLALSAGVQSETRMKDFFEAFNIGREGNTWPDVVSFQDAVQEWFAEAGRVARTMTEIFEDALGLERGFFAGLSRNPIEVLRMNNYALPAGTRIELDEDLIGMGEHTDYGIVTILWADQVKGLQVLGGDGGWHDVQPADGALLINLGDLTTRLTNEQWLSTLHRVKPPIVVDEQGIGTINRRRSAALFFDGDPEAVIGPLPAFVDEEHPAIYAPVTVDEHIAAKLAGSRAGVLNEGAAREAERVLSAY
ncbi:isopenicillin N synthase family dioxygenase [Nocardioides sp. Kera G14]|uniref:isopenicillin N synthase family dioxygenase n=1 Tax=Nocardioides sp. Kera G14 TaxID=2884264 RepID=UPI001D1203F0|nr:2-oxoglutarate and iron-dependent oxygenase domain-containing protein [Nocardioides sp. Kera G14]UDY24512.1 isopenicillin N synthase family oxygenase [Nocardioides sp. Kera G14]